jgi:hypothetical protein
MRELGHTPRETSGWIAPLGSGKSRWLLTALALMPKDAVLIVNPQPDLARLVQK